MSYKSYAYDPQGNKHETYVKDGKTYTSSGDRLGAGWTSQTAGGIYKMGSDGVGQKVSSHNTSSNNNYSSNSSSNYSQPITNDGRVYGTTSDGRDWQTGEQVVNYSYRDGRDNSDNQGNRGSNPINDSSIYRSDGYFWTDPNSAEYVAVRLPNGTTTSLPKDKAQEMIANNGYEYIAPSFGLGKWNTETAIRNGVAGKDWVDDGRQPGSVQLRDSNGKMISVNAVYADKYFKEGYTLDAKSQSINRALMSNSQLTSNATDSAIRGGTYNSNTDYSGGSSHVGGDMYERMYGGNSFSAPIVPQQQIIPQESFIPQQQVIPQNNSNNVRYIGNGTTVEKTDSNKWLINMNGQNVELNEDDYIKYMSELLGL